MSVDAELYVCLKSDLKIVDITTAPKSKDLVPCDGFVFTE